MPVDTQRLPITSHLVDIQHARAEAKFVCIHAPALRQRDQQIREDVLVLLNRNVTTVFEPTSKSAKAANSAFSITFSSSIFRRFLPVMREIMPVVLHPGDFRHGVHATETRRDRTAGISLQHEDNPSSLGMALLRLA